MIIGIGHHTCTKEWADAGCVRRLRSEGVMVARVDPRASGDGLDAFLICPCIYDEGTVPRGVRVFPSINQLLQWIHEKEEE